jgi:hypothetical protein
VNAEIMTIPAGIRVADFPVMYTNAVKALARCDAVDECKDIADKAAALAAYAKQAGDETLQNYAHRIKARAVRRCGELAKQIEPAKGGDRRSKGGHPPVDSRKAAANGAGLSPHQLKQAIRVANVSEAEFERQVESDKPPTVTALAAQGVLHKDHHDQRVDDAPAERHRQGMVVAADEICALLTALGGWPITAMELKYAHKKAQAEARNLRRRLATAEKQLAEVESQVIETLAAAIKRKKAGAS